MEVVGAEVRTREGFQETQGYLPIRRLRPTRLVVLHWDRDYAVVVVVVAALLTGQEELVPVEFGEAHLPELEGVLGVADCCRGVQGRAGLRLIEF